MHHPERLSLSEVKCWDWDCAGKQCNNLRKMFLRVELGKNLGISLSTVNINKRFRESREINTRLKPHIGSSWFLVFQTALHLKQAGFCSNITVWAQEHFRKPSSYTHKHIRHTHPPQGDQKTPPFCWGGLLAIRVEACVHITVLGILHLKKIRGKRPIVSALAVALHIFLVNKTTRVRISYLGLSSFVKISSVLFILAEPLKLLLTVWLAEQKSQLSGDKLGFKTWSLWQTYQAALTCSLLLWLQVRTAKNNHCIKWLITMAFLYTRLPMFCFPRNVLRISLTCQELHLGQAWSDHHTRATIKNFFFFFLKTVPSRGCFFYL